MLRIRPRRVCARACHKSGRSLPPLISSCHFLRKRLIRHDIREATAPTIANTSAEIEINMLREIASAAIRKNNTAAIMDVITPTTTKTRLSGPCILFHPTKNRADIPNGKQPSKFVPLMNHHDIGGFVPEYLLSLQFRYSTKQKISKIDIAPDRNISPAPRMIGLTATEPAACSTVVNARTNAIKHKSTPSNQSSRRGSPESMPLMIPPPNTEITGTEMTVVNGSARTVAQQFSSSQAWPNHQL